MNQDNADGLVMGADIDAAFSRLPLDKARTLFWRYINGPGDSAERKRESRAVDALTGLLNDRLRDRPFGPGSRRAMSNAAAIAMTRGIDV